jgi:hypothetical protein
VHFILRIDCTRAQEYWKGGDVLEKLSDRLNVRVLHEVDATALAEVCGGPHLLVMIFAILLWYSSYFCDSEPYLETSRSLV